MNLTFSPTDDNIVGSDSDIDLQDEDIAEASCSGTEHMSKKSEETLQNKPALSKCDDDQDTMKDRTLLRTSDDMYSTETDSSKKHMSEIRDGVLPMMSQTQSLSSLSSGHLQTLDGWNAHSQQFLKFGAPLLFNPGQLSAKPEGMGHLLSSLPGVNNLENGGLSSQSITSPSPFMFHMSQHMLASQVRFSRSTLF